MQVNLLTSFSSPIEMSTVGTAHSTMQAASGTRPVLIQVESEWDGFCGLGHEMALAPTLTAGGMC
jgi:hypothetical protein